MDITTYALSRKYTDEAIASSGGGGSTRTKTLLYDSESTTAGLAYNTLATLNDDIGNYDQLEIILGCPGDGGIAQDDTTNVGGYITDMLVEVDSLLNINNSTLWTGYDRRNVRLIFRSSNTLITFGSAPGETNRTCYVYKIYGIKY